MAKNLEKKSRFANIKNIVKNNKVILSGIFMSDLAVMLSGYSAINAILNQNYDNAILYSAVSIASLFPCSYFHYKFLKNNKK